MTPRRVDRPRVVGAVGAGGRRVSFRHPATGASHAGHVVGTGARGVTVRDDKGTHHQIDHGRYIDHGAAPGEPNDEAKGLEQGAERSGKAKRFEALAALHGALPTFRARARAHMRLGPDNDRAHVAAAALLSSHLGDHAHDLPRTDVKVDGDRVSVANDKHDTDARDPHLAAFLRAHHRDEPKAAIGRGKVRKEDVDEYLTEHLGGGVKDIAAHQRTMRWSEQAQKLGKPRNAKHAAALAERAAYAAGVDLDHVDPTVRAAHERRGALPPVDADGDPGHSAAEHRFGRYLSDVRRHDPHGLRSGEG